MDKMSQSKFFIILVCLALLSLWKEAEGISVPFPPGIKRGNFQVRFDSNEMRTHRKTLSMLK